MDPLADSTISINSAVTRKLDFLNCGFNFFPNFQIFWDFLKSQKSHMGAELIEMVYSKIFLYFARERQIYRL